MAYIAASEACVRLGVSRRQLNRWLGKHLRSDHRHGRLWIAREDVEAMEVRAGIVEAPDHSVAIVRALDDGKSLAKIVAEVGATVAEVERVAAWWSLVERPIVVPPNLVGRLASALACEAAQLLTAPAVETVERVERLRDEILAHLGRASRAG